MQNRAAIMPAANIKAAPQGIARGDADVRAGAGNCARERHFQSIENPSNAECDADKCVETSPGKALKPSRDISLDQSRFRL